MIIRQIAACFAIAAVIDNVGWWAATRPHHEPPMPHIIQPAQAEPMRQFITVPPPAEGTKP